MGIKLINNPIKNSVKAFQERLENAVIKQLQILGEELAKYAKDQHNYLDQTGNLTNSIGYAVVKQGKILNYGGEIQPGEGAAEGLKTAQQMAATLPNSFSLIIVAGMNYAAYVEAKGYNVILPAQLKAMKDFPEVMKKLQDKVKKITLEEFNSHID